MSECSVRTQFISFYTEIADENSFYTKTGAQTSFIINVKCTRTTHISPLISASL